jgi:hypothetical protein
MDFSVCRIIGLISGTSRNGVGVMATASSASSPDVFHHSPPRAVTVRVVFFSLLLAAFFGYIEPIIDLKLSNTFLGATHLPPGALGVLVLLLLLNAPLGWLSKKLAFSRREVLCVYIACLFSVLVAGHGAENFFVACLLAPFYYATPENKWLLFLQKYLPSWFSPSLQPSGHLNVAAFRGWYDGAQGVVPWNAWLVPLAAWSTLLLASYIMLACLAVMLRAQWSEKEALAFPLLKFPVEMTAHLDGQGDFWKNRAMWLGFGLAAFIQLANGLHGYFPDVPPIPLTINSAPYLTEAPWNQIGDVPIIVWPLVVGVTFLLTTEISFSLWAFYWLTKFQFIGAWALGYPPATLPGIPGFGGVPAFMSYARIGAYFAYAGGVFWVGREHWKFIARRAFGRQPSTPEEAGEALSYPIAFWGFVLSLGVLIAWSVAAGMRADVAIGLWISYLVIALALTRLVVEGGVLFVQHQWMPLGVMAQLFGSGPNAWLQPQSIVPASFVQTAMIHDLRGFLLPSFVQSFKLARDEKIPLRPLLPLVMSATVVALGVSLWMRVRLGYEIGGTSLNAWTAVAGPKWPPRISAAIMDGTHGRGLLNWIWLGSGVLFTGGLMLLRSRFLGFPLHPLGYLVALTFSMDVLWTSIFVGWLCKALVLKFGGHETYKKATPFFMGVAIGDLTMMLFWLCVDGWLGHVSHQLMPG